MVISLLFRNKDFKVHVIEVPILSFGGTLQTYRENKYMKFKRYLYLSYLSSELKSARCISKASSIFISVEDCAVIFFGQVCVNCTCFDLTTTLPHPFLIFTNF